MAGVHTPYLGLEAANTAEALFDDRPASPEASNWYRVPAPSAIVAPSIAAADIHNRRLIGAGERSRSSTAGPIKASVNTRMTLAKPNAIPNRPALSSARLPIKARTRNSRAVRLAMLPTRSVVDVAVHSHMYGLQPYNNAA